MFKIDKPEKFDVTLHVRCRQGQSNTTQVRCPCQDPTKMMIKVCNLPDHYRTTISHETWMKDPTKDIQSIEAVIKTVAKNN